MIQNQEQHSELEALVPDGGPNDENSEESRHDLGPVNRVKSLLKVVQPRLGSMTQYSHKSEGEAVNRTDDLDKTLRETYAAISFPEGGEPDWERMRAVFHAQARLTRITPEGIDHFDLPSFQAMAREMLDRGVYTSYFEEETARKAQIFGSLAHVLSAYETKRSSDAASCLTRGVNSIQLVWQGGSWRVLSLLWDEATPGNSLDVLQRLTVTLHNELEDIHALLKRCWMNSDHSVHSRVEAGAGSVDAWPGTNGSPSRC